MVIQVFELASENNKCINRICAKAAQTGYAKCYIARGEP